MDEVSNAEIMAKLEAQEKDQKARDDRDAEFRGYMKRSLQDVTDVVTLHGKRIETLERDQGETRRIAEDARRDAATAETRFGYRVDQAVGALKTEMAGRLGAQDTEIAAIKERTAVLDSLRDYVVGSKATMAFLKWAILAIPIVVGIILGIAHYAAMTSASPPVHQTSTHAAPEAP